MFLHPPQIFSITALFLKLTKSSFVGGAGIVYLLQRRHLMFTDLKILIFIGGRDEEAGVNSTVFIGC